MDVKEVAQKQIKKLRIIIGQISEAEDLLAALESLKLNDFDAFTNDVSVGIPIQFGAWTTVRLNGDLGITDIQEEIRKLVTESVQKRIDVLKSELRKTIYHTGDYHE